MGHRDQLLEAAKRLLEERGYAHITARDLVAASNTNLASIGYHFGSKAALLNAAIEASFQDWTEQLASLVMADEDATPIQRGMATWVSVLKSLPQRRPMLQSYVEALAQAQREPALRSQLAEHYRRARSRVAELVALSLRDGTTAEDPRCLAIAAFVIAVCDGLSMQCPDRSGRHAGRRSVRGGAGDDLGQLLPRLGRGGPTPVGATCRR